LVINSGGLPIGLFPPRRPGSGLGIAEKHFKIFQAIDFCGPQNNKGREWSIQASGNESSVEPLKVCRHLKINNWISEYSLERLRLM
jgi:hypothetical protein